MRITQEIPSGEAGGGTARVGVGTCGMGYASGTHLCGRKGGGEGKQLWKDRAERCGKATCRGVEGKGLSSGKAQKWLVVHAFCWW